MSSGDLVKYCRKMYQEVKRKVAATEAKKTRSGIVNREAWQGGYPLCMICSYRVPARKPDWSAPLFPSHKRGLLRLRYAVHRIRVFAPAIPWGSIEKN